MSQLEKSTAGVSQETLDRLQSIISTLQNEKDSLAQRLENANRARIDLKAGGASHHVDYDEEDSEDEQAKENYLFMREAGLVFSSAHLATRLRQPKCNRPAAFSKVYVCDFELDFISRDDTEVLLKPMASLRSKNA